MNVLTNNGTFFNELRRINQYEKNQFFTRSSSLSTTHKKEPLFQQAENRSRNYARAGQQVFREPAASKLRGITVYNEGRSLSILQSLERNQVFNTPDGFVQLYTLPVVTKY